MHTTGDTARHWIPAPDREHEAVLYHGRDGWTLQLPGRRPRIRLDVPTDPDLAAEAAAVSAALDIIKENGLWKAGGDEFWRKYRRWPTTPEEADPPPGLASPAAWREQHT